MPKNAVSDWDTTAGNNTDVGGININEGMSPGNVNNALREAMAQIKTYSGLPVTPADLSVTTAKLASEAVAAGKIAAGAVTTAKIGDGQVTTAKIGDDQVTLAKIAPAAVVIASETIASNNNDTTLPTSAAVKAYADTAVAAGRAPDAHFAGNYVSGVGTLPITVTLRNTLTGSIGLGSNLITLQAGTYIVQGIASARATGTPAGAQSASVAFWDSTGAAGIGIVFATRGATTSAGGRGIAFFHLTPGAANNYSLNFARESSDWSAEQPALPAGHSGVTSYDHEVLIWKLV